MIARRPPAWIRAAVLPLVLALSLSSSLGQDGDSTIGSIHGKVTAGSKKTPVAGATVLVYHLATAAISRSAPTDEKGRYELSGLTHGYYDMAVEAPDGLFVGNQVVNLVPGGKVVSNFDLQPGAAGEGGPRDFPGSDQPAAGIARYLEKSFWTKPKGVAIWAGGSAAALALLLSAGGSSGGGAVVSCSVPPCP